MYILVLQQRIGALKGPLHGGANENVMKMLTEIGEEENVESYIHNALQNKVKIMGFGHRVYEQGDPRAKHLREMSKRLCVLLGEEKWYNMSIKIEDIVTKEKVFHQMLISIQLLYTIV